MNKLGTYNVKASIRRHLTRIVSFLIWIAIWQVIALIVNNDLIFAGPWHTACALVELMGTLPFWWSVWATVFTISGGFLIACVLGMLCGLLAYHSEKFHIFIQPIVEACKSIPVACIIVVLMLWFGSGGVVMAVVFLISFPAYFEAMLKSQQAAGQISKNALFRMGVPKRNIWLAFIWPQTLQFLEATSRNAVGTAWKAGIAAQVIGLLGGTLGDSVYNAKLLLETSKLFALTMVIVFLAWICEQVFLLILTGSRRACIHFSLRRPALNPKPPQEILVKDINFSYKESMKEAVLKHFSLNAKPDEVVQLIGPTGSGKTTLIGLILGTLTPASGSVQVPLYISYSPQILSLPSTLTVGQIITLVGCYKDIKTAEELVKKHLGPEILVRNCAELSGGQSRFVQLILALFAPTQALLLDEPFEGMDEDMKKVAYKLVKTYQYGRPMLISTHRSISEKLLQARPITLTRL